MKNRFLRRAHLSEEKCNHLLRLFSDDMTATQIAGITGISRVTVNNYLRLLRVNVAEFCEEHNPRTAQDRKIFLQSAESNEMLNIYKYGNQFMIDMENVVVSHGSDSSYMASVDPASLKMNANGKSDDQELKDFWKYVRGRLKKFRGLRKNMLYLHLKESEFRYNFKNTDLFSLMAGIIYKKSLGTAGKEQPSAEKAASLVS